MFEEYILIYFFLIIPCRKKNITHSVDQKKYYAPKKISRESYPFQKNIFCLLLLGRILWYASCKSARGLGLDLEIAPSTGEDGINQESVIWSDNFM